MRTIVGFVYTLKPYERGIQEFLGKYSRFVLPGLGFQLPIFQMIRVRDIREHTVDIPPQPVITKDNVTVKVNAVIYFRVINPLKAIIEVENYLYATSQLSQTTLRSVCGQAELDELLSKREEVSAHIQSILDRQTDPWGIKVSAVELKHIDLPEEMQRAMAKQAEAERERRAKVIHAEGEKQAAQALMEAAAMLSREPAAMQLRYLQTLTQVAGDKSSTLVFPVPVDLIGNLLGRGKDTAPGDAG